MEKVSSHGMEEKLWSFQTTWRKQKSSEINDVWHSVWQLGEGPEIPIFMAYNHLSIIPVVFYALYDW